MKLYTMIGSSASALGEYAAKRQRMPHEDLDTSGFEPADIYYGQYLGAYPLTSPLEIDNGWHSRHASAVRQDIKDRRGRRGPAALGCIDYENWKLLHDGEPLSQHPDAGRYEACAAAVVRTALVEASITHPETKWGYYDWPGFPWNAEYPDRLKEYHDRTRYVIDSSKAFYVVFYLPPGRTDYSQWTSPAYRNTIAECERLDPTKPIIALLSRAFATDPWEIMPEQLQKNQADEVASALFHRRFRNPDDGIAVWAAVNRPSDLPSIQAHLNIVRKSASPYIP